MILQKLVVWKKVNNTTLFKKQNKHEFVPETIYIMLLIISYLMVADDKTTKKVRSLKNHYIYNKLFILPKKEKEKLRLKIVVSQNCNLTNFSIIIKKMNFLPYIKIS